MPPPHRDHTRPPDSSTWHGSTTYERWIEERGRSYTLLTDSSREQVYSFFVAM